MQKVLAEGGIFVRGPLDHDRADQIRFNPIEPTRDNVPSISDLRSGFSVAYGYGSI
jgi:hypothetical protein